MNNYSNFTLPKDEATVKLYTDVSKNCRVSNPTILTQRLRSGSHCPMLKKI